MYSNPMHPRRAPRTSAGYALTLFMLGAVVGLLALLARLAQELQATLLRRFAVPLWRTSAPVELAPLLHALDVPGARLVAGGFAVSTLCLLLAALLWRGAGHPASLRERIWARFAHAVALLLWASMGVVLLVALPVVRIAVLVAGGGLALVILIAFVYLLLEFQFLGSAPPLPDEQPHE